MSTVSSLRSLIALTLLGVAPLLAQDKQQLCNDVQHRPMQVGQWAGYQWTGGRTDGTTMRMALIGTEQVEGSAFYWYELAITDPKRGPKGKTILQMLVNGLGVGSGGVRGLIMKNGDDPATRMPDQMVQMMGGRMMGRNLAAEIARRCQEMELVGWEQITVPAGSFRALHIKDASEGTEAWVQPDVYFGVVKVVSKDGTMELTGRGADAKSSITEKPRSM